MIEYIVDAFPPLTRVYCEASRYRGTAKTAYFDGCCEQAKVGLGVYQAVGYVQLIKQTAFFGDGRATGHRLVVALAALAQIKEQVVVNSIPDRLVPKNHSSSGKHTYKNCKEG
jgi:hypothetical protein